MDENSESKSLDATDIEVKEQMDSSSANFESQEEISNTDEDSKDKNVKTNQPDELELESISDDELESNSEKKFPIDDKTKSVGENSVFDDDDDISRIPDQILAEPSDKLDENTENEVTSNIIEQLKQFDGSDDEDSLQQEDPEYNNDNQKTNRIKNDENFEEADVTMSEKDKSGHINETDALSDDRTQESVAGRDENNDTPMVEDESMVSVNKSHFSLDGDEDLSELNDEDKSSHLDKPTEKNMNVNEDVDVDKDADADLGKSTDKNADGDVDKNTDADLDKTVELEDVEMHSMDDKEYSMDKTNHDIDPLLKSDQNEKGEQNKDDDHSMLDESQSTFNKEVVNLDSSVEKESEENITADGDKIPESNDSSSKPNDESLTREENDGGEGEAEETCLLPDSEQEITEDEKQRAILAREIAEKEIDDQTNINQNEESNDKNVEAENDLGNQSSAIDNINLEDDQLDGFEDNEPIDTNDLNEFDIKELSDEIPDEKCFKCRKPNPCKYKFLKNNEIKYLCDLKCVHLYRTSTKEKYNLIARKVIITCIVETKQECVKCKIEKNCRYRFKNPDDIANFLYLCESQCLNSFIGKNIEKYLVRRKKYIVEELLNEEEQKCIHCGETKLCKYNFKQDEDTLYICHDICFNLLEKEEPERFRLKRRSVRVRDLSAPNTNMEVDPKIIARSDDEAEAARIDREASFIRRCAQCFNTIQVTDKTLEWETLDFCNELCLGKYQNVIGAACTTCNNSVPLQSLGKYCVRFGFDIRQFCCSSCLDRFKKGLKVCSCCQKDISKDKEGFLASVGDKGQFKDFCSQSCMKHYDEMCNLRKKSTVALCAVCNNDKLVRIEFTLDSRDHSFCSNPCFSAFKFVNNIYPDQCTVCTKFFERKCSEAYTVYIDKNPIVFCCKVCMNIYIVMNRKIVPCQWCKVKKYNFDMIQKQCGPQTLMLCSLNCLTLYGVSLNAISRRTQLCDHCNQHTTAQYHLTMSDATIRNFCTYQCVMSFQSQFGRTPITIEDGNGSSLSKSPFPTGLPKRVKAKSNTVGINASSGSTNITEPMIQLTEEENVSSIPVICNVTSLADNQTTIGNTVIKRTLRKGRNRGNSATPTQSEDDQPLFHISLGTNKRTRGGDSGKKTIGIGTGKNDAEIISSDPVQLEEPRTHVIMIPPEPCLVANKKTMCKPATATKAISCKPNTCSVQCQTDESLDRKVIVPIPIPIYVPQPMHMYSSPFPVPVPIPLPIPVPIFIPTTRNSADGILKEIKKIQDKMPTDPFEAELLMMAEMVAGDKKKNESDSDSDDGGQNDTYTGEALEPTNTFGEDVLQMALKMATDYDEPAVDLESAMTANTITPQSPQHISHEEAVDDPHHMMILDDQRDIIPRGRKRALGSALQRNNRLLTQPTKRTRHRAEMQIIPQPEEPREPAEKPDANMCLKYTFGVNAWKQWVMTKNADLEKSSIRRKPFKSELLQLTADELNYSLCLFVKEVRKPNGSEYAPDTIYYLVLGIQQYLYENGRIDNIFTDPYYERFTDCLDEVARKFSVLYNDSQYIVTRVEEEHLWECKQLGAHSPHVLLSTLMFFNTKHFNLTTVEEHMQLSFSHIMKHWKRSPPGAKTPGSRNVLLRFYPPQTEANSRKKKVYEQQENEENPLRCPVKLYEFYLSKCPESVKTRNDVFYLQPERSCVPDSPVWYSTQPLSREALVKMLHRVKMVKEINIALLTSY